MRKSRFVFALLFVLTIAMLIIMPALAQFAPGKMPPAAVMTRSSETIAQTPAAPTAKLPNVVILATGGTIAGTGATSTTTVGYQAAKLPVAALISAVPELKKIANVTGEQVLQIASENMTNAGLLKLADRVNAVLAKPDVDGVVITHGTDTIEETAYFLNLVTKSQKPVVIVGSMRPATALSADGPLNLYNAVAIAGSPTAVGKGVLVSLNDQISAAREVTKINTTSLNTFQTPDLGYLGYVELGKPYFYRTPARKHTTATPFTVTTNTKLPQVDIIYGYGNNSPVLLNAAIADGAKGIVYAGVGDGSISMQLEPAAIAARQKGVIIARSSRTGSGRIVRNGEEKDDEHDFIVTDNLNPQKARILLMLGLTITSDTKALQEMFYTY
ncbi:asparaginase [Stenomitos frigidus]|uniref:asparaginase n=1 Tax=Stenomitos frigidus ULC18 TaxID=2107698 RepID=A0A2T1DSW6_9CYAN|nr:asparaginase [Stenomitos frigidus]PSB23599.1 L-asparaginase [Stenomitos frigidus ULC18]